MEVTSFAAKKRYCNNPGRRGMRNSNMGATTSKASEPLSKEEQEHAELTETLKELDCQIEDNMTMDEMRNLVKVLNESKNTSMQGEHHSSEENEIITSKSPSPIRLPTPSFSYRDQPNILKRDKEERKTANFLEKNDNDLIYDGSTSPNLSKKQNTSSSSSFDQARRSLSLNNSWKIPRNKILTDIDPHNFIIDEDDQPLESESDDDDFDKKTVIMEDRLKDLAEGKLKDVIERIGNELEKMRWNEIEKELAANNGDWKRKPIQVTYYNTLEELEAALKTQETPKIIANKNSRVNATKSNSAKFNNTFTTDLPERAAKRKANNNIDAAINGESDENDEFLHSKKGKFHNSDSDQDYVPENSPEDIITIDDIPEPNSKQSNTIKPNSSLPRRIPPPKPNYKGPRGTNKGKAKPNNKKEPESLNDEEIADLLGDDQDEDCKITDIKQTQNKSKTLGRMNAAAKTLQKNKEAEENKLRVAQREKENKEKQEEENRKKIAKQRAQEEEEKNKKATAQGRKAKEREIHYKAKLNNVLTNKQTNNVRNNQPLAPRATNSSFTTTDDVEEINEVLSKNKTKCPICQQFFSEDQITEHASECNLFPDDNDEPIYKVSYGRDVTISKTKLLCNICEHYTTSDHQSYEEHVDKCKRFEDVKRDCHRT